MYCRCLIEHYLRAVQIFYELVETYLVSNHGPRVFAVVLTIHQERDVAIYITHLKPEPREAFERAGLVERLGESAFCKDVSSAMARIEQTVTRQV